MSTLQNQVLRGYEFQEQVGAGGFGSVYRAYQPAVGREVAVKVILPQHANHPDFIRRFEYEAQFVARLEHPHIVPLYDYWREPDGAYLVMRWLPRSLRRILDEHGAWSLKDTALLLDQITAALAVAHRQGVIHRDIKPDNILLDEDGNTYLADFGIAKDLTSTENTEEEGFIGSPVYLTPEQIKSEPVSPQTDIYSLGVVLYEMLTGEKPFPNLAATALLMKHLYDPLPPLSALKPELPSALDAVIQKATAKNPSKRYRKAMELASAFRVAVQSPRYAEDQLLLGPLTPREMDIMRLIADDMSNQEIAEKLVLSPGTVKWYVKQIFSKLDVHSRPQATGRAQEILRHIADRKAAATSGAYEDESEELLIVTEMVRPYDLVSPPVENPYKGLRAFQEADAADFFGREALIGQLVKRLKEKAENNRFLAVIGPSGSGKSSVVRAGLVPGLRRGVLPKSESWFVVEMLPGSHPLEELEAALLRIAVNPPDSLISQLREDERGLLRAVKRVLPSEDDVELVIVIDQFEELFTLVESEEVRAHFLNSLVTAVADPQSRVRVIVTLRADFTDQPLLYARFGKLMSQRSEFVLPLNADEVKQAITGPAERVGLNVETDLVGEIIREVVAQPGTLPLLEYALSELFEQREDSRLTLETYRASGGVLKALGRRADDLFEELTPEGKQAARQMFLRLVTLGEGTDDARRRTLQSELTSVVGNPQVMDDVIDVYSQFRLLTLDRDPISHGPTVEVAHEALLREWGRLRGWLNESRADIQLQRQLAGAAHEWNEAGKDASFLLRGSRLGQFESWTATTDLALTGLEQGYLDASLTHRGEEQIVESERQAREQRLERRSVSTLRVLVGVLLAATLVAVGLSVFALNENSAAQESARLATSRELAASAINNLDVDPERSILLALQAVKISMENGGPVLIEAQDALHRSIQSSHLLATLRGHDAPLWSLKLSNDEERMVTVGEDGSIKVWDLASNQVLFDLPGAQDFTGTVTANAALSPDGTKLLAVSAENTATLWDLDTQQPLFKLSGHSGPVTAVAISPDGKLLATSSQDATAKLWDAATGKELATLVGHEAGIEALAFSSDSARLYGGSDLDGLAIAWDVASGKELFRFSGQAAVTGVEAIAASPDGQRIATGEFDTTVRIWDAASGNLLLTMFGHSSQVVSVAYSPDGKYVASASEDGTAKIWDALTGREILTLAGHTSGVLSVAYSADGQRVYTASRDRTVKIWDVSSSSGGDRLNLAHDTRVTSVAYRPDGKQLATWSTAGTVKVWDALSGEVLLTIPLEGGEGGGNLNDLSYSPDSKRLAIVSGRMVRILDADSGAELLALPPFNGTLAAVQFSPDGKQLAVGWDIENVGIIQLYDSTSAQLIREFGTSDAIQQLAFSPDGKRIVSAATSGPYSGATVWDAATGKKLLTFTGHGGVNLAGVAFSPDGKWISSSGNDASIRVWDSETGEEIFNLTGHRGPTFSAVFSPDGRYLASSSVDRTIKIWTLPSEGGTVETPLTLYGHTGAIYRIAFSPDGNYLATVGRNPTVRIYALHIDELIAIAKSRLTRSLTEAECLQYLHMDSCPAGP